MKNYEYLRKKNKASYPNPFLFTNFKNKLAISSRGLDRINTENSNFQSADPFLEACFLEAKFSVSRVWN